MHNEFSVVLITWLSYSQRLCLGHCQDFASDGNYCGWHSLSHCIFVWLLSSYRNSSFCSGLGLVWKFVCSFGWIGWRRGRKNWCFLFHLIPGAISKTLGQNSDLRLWSGFSIPHFSKVKVWGSDEDKTKLIHSQGDYTLTLIALSFN